MLLPGDKTTKVILLNGTSSSGKTSIGKALQKILSEPYFHAQIDSFEEMIPDRPDLPPQMSFAIRASHQAYAAIAHSGVNLIVDHVIIEGEEPLNWLRECIELLSPFQTYFIGVHCSLEELKRREIKRGDRPMGLPEWQSNRIHLHGVYDLEVDTTNRPPEDCAQEIKQLVESNFVPQAVNTLVRKLAT